jgi:hypothetical protein
MSVAAGNFSISFGFAVPGVYFISLGVEDVGLLTIL